MDFTKTADTICFFSILPRFPIEVFCGFAPIFPHFIGGKKSSMKMTFRDKYRYLRTLDFQAISTLRTLNFDAEKYWIFVLFLYRWL